MLSFFTFQAAKAQGENQTLLIDGTVINSRDQIDLNTINTDAIEKLIFNNLNAKLKKKGLNEFTEQQLFKQASADQAAYMASIYDDEPIQEDKDKATVADRLYYYGGSSIGTELVEKESLTKSGTTLTYGKLADDIVFGWFSSTKKAEIIESGEYTFIGVSARCDENKKKVFIAATFGNYKSYNDGIAYKDRLSIPYSEKTYGLLPPDKTFCKKINRSQSANELHDALSVEDNVIYISTEDVRDLKRIVRKSKDGLAVDILQKEQFNCETPNIVDHSQFQQGIITKKLYAKKLFKKNLADLDENKRAFKTPLGVIPPGIMDYELNLLIIQNKHMCRSITQNFIIQTNGTYTRNVKLLADTVSLNSRFQYKPVADSMALTLRIPFEKNKATYETKDIEPFIKLLNEPEFFIYELEINAFSSIEGSDEKNKKLQEDRALSIIKALKSRQKDSIKTEIITAYNWNDFKRDIKNSKHNVLASMELDEAQAYIRKYNLEKEIEPILAKHRYAQINMKVTYDISGANEMPFVIKKFNEASSNEDYPLALSIQKYMMKQILRRNYPVTALDQLNMEETAPFAGMLMNNYWLKYKTKEITEDELLEKINVLAELSSDNEYINFNKLLLQVDNQFKTSEADYMQSLIDRLYYSHLPKSTVDGLNIRFQFKRINAAEDEGNDPANAKIKEECIERIKTIVDIRDESLENSLKLAELFIDNKDYEFALKTLDPWLTYADQSEDLTFTYVSLCSQFEDKMHSQKFNYAMEAARKLNPDRFCELLNGEYFSLKVFENSNIKDSYCKYCTGKESMVSIQP